MPSLPPILCRRATRRSLAGCLAAVVLAELPIAAATVPVAAPTSVTAGGPAFSYPIGDRGRPFGVGFFIRDAYASENTWYLPGYWHTAEDWYRRDGETAGAHVYAIAAGTIVHADSNYPGRVVIVRHAGGLYSMYGHLDPALAVRVDQHVARGARLGTVLDRQDGVPSHLHFEVRTFLETSAVNGDAPRYDFACGVDCPPGPGYWPIAAPDHPSNVGWRNPTHVINRRAWSVPSTGALGEVVVADRPSAATIDVWSAPAGKVGAREIGTLPLSPGDHVALLAVQTGPEDATGTSADAYSLWYQIRLASGRQGWVQAAVPSTFDIGSDGRPSSIMFDFLPMILAMA